MLVTTSNSRKRLLIESLSLSALVMATVYTLTSFYDFITIYNAYESTMQENSKWFEKVCIEIC